MEVIYDFIMNLANSGGPIITLIIIYFESIFAAIPLAIFIALAFIQLGYVFGFISAYVITILGCITSFYLSRLFKDKLRKIKKINKLMSHMDTITLPNLVLITAIPFSPAFAINIAAGLTNMESKKFILCLLIAKVFTVFFWGFIGASLSESIKNPKTLIIIVLMIIIAYLISKFVTKKFKVD